jgi:hypothetical protein
LFEALIVACLVLTPALLLSGPPLLHCVWLAARTLAATDGRRFRSVPLDRAAPARGPRRDWENPVAIASLMLEAMVHHGQRDGAPYPGPRISAADLMNLNRAGLAPGACWWSPAPARVS